MKLSGQGDPNIGKATDYTVGAGAEVAQAQHTPGPWVIQSMGPDEPMFIMAVGKFPQWPFVAQMCEREVTDKDEREANAALIASAPWLELLVRAQLKGWRLFCEQGAWYLNHRQKADELAWDCVDDMDDEIPACPDAETFERIRKAVQGA